MIEGYRRTKELRGKKEWQVWGKIVSKERKASIKRTEKWKGGKKEERETNKNKWMIELYRRTKEEERGNKEWHVCGKIARKERKLSIKGREKWKRGKEEGKETNKNKWLIEGHKRTITEEGKARG